MVLFYEPKNGEDLARIEDVLRNGGIEYFLQDEPEGDLGPKRILVAEEDIPAAEALLIREQTRH